MLASLAGMQNQLLDKVLSKFAYRLMAVECHDIRVDSLDAAPTSCSVVQEVLLLKVIPSFLKAKLDVALAGHQTHCKSLHNLCHSA